MIGVAAVAMLTMLILPTSLLLLDKDKKWPFVKSALKFSGVALVDDIQGIIRGVTKIAAWPLTVLRMPVRGLITLFSDVSAIEDSKGLRELVTKFKATTDVTSQAQIYRAITGKYESACSKGQKTNIERQAYNN